MTSNDVFVYKLYLRENELRNICAYYKMFDTQADDIIQEAYMRMLVFPNIIRYETQTGEPNMNVMFTVIRNLIFDFRKAENKYYNCEQIDTIDEDTEESEHPFNRLLAAIDDMKETSKSQWFEKQIIKLYVEGGHTIRSLEAATKITRSTIQPIIHKFKEEMILKVKNNTL